MRRHSTNSVSFPEEHVLVTDENSQIDSTSEKLTKLSFERPNRGILKKLELPSTSRNPISELTGMVRDEILRVKDLMIKQDAERYAKRTVYKFVTGMQYSYTKEEILDEVQNLVKSMNSEFLYASEIRNEYDNIMSNITPLTSAERFHTQKVNKYVDKVFDTIDSMHNKIRDDLEQRLSCVENSPKITDGIMIRIATVHEITEKLLNQLIYRSCIEIIHQKRMKAVRAEQYEKMIELKTKILSELMEQIQSRKILALNSGKQDILKGLQNLEKVLNVVSVRLNTWVETIKIVLEATQIGREFDFDVQKVNSLKLEQQRLRDDFRDEFIEKLKQFEAQQIEQKLRGIKLSRAQLKRRDELIIKINNYKKVLANITNTLKERNLYYYIDLRPSKPSERRNKGLFSGLFDTFCPRKSVLIEDIDKIAEQNFSMDTISTESLRRPGIPPGSKVLENGSSGICEFIGNIGSLFCPKSDAPIEVSQLVNVHDETIRQSTSQELLAPELSLEELPVNSDFDTVSVSDPISRRKLSDCVNVINRSFIRKVKSYPDIRATL